MLTGGIDLSVGAIASMSGFVVATLVRRPGTWLWRSLVALVAAVIVGLVTGVGVGVFRVHPLIMTLGMGLVVLGLANVWQITNVHERDDRRARPVRTVGSSIVPRHHPLQPRRLRAPVAAFVLILLRRSGYGRLLYALGDNPIAARLVGRPRLAGPARAVRHLCGPRWRSPGSCITGLTNVASVSLVDSAVLPSVAAAVIGGTSIFGGRGGYRRDDRRSAHPDGRRVAPHRLSATPRPSARSSSARSSSPSPPPTRGSPARPDGPMDRRSATRHLGLDLGGTNIKWVVVEHEAGDWESLDRDQVATPAADGPDAVDRPPRDSRRRGDQSQSRGLDGRDRGPGTLRPGRRDARGSS